MKERRERDANKKDRASKTSSANSLPLILDIDDFKGDFSFDALFGNLVNELLPSFQEEETDSSEGHGHGHGHHGSISGDVMVNGHHMRVPSDLPKLTQGLSTPLFPEVDALLSLFKDSHRELVDLRKQIDGKLNNLKKEVSVQDTKHRKTLAELEKGVDGLFDSFARLDSRISSVGQTAAKIGDHLQSADSQRETASQTIELIKYLMEFNGSPGDLMELSPLFSDDSRVAEAASTAQKLRAFAEEDIGSQGIAAPSVMGNATASRGLEVAVANLQDYCNELENRLLSRFDAASQKRELSTMAECAKILSQFNRGTSAMQHYVITRPMFIDVEVMTADSRLVLGDQGSQLSPNNVARGLSSLYREITDTVRKEAATITAVFPAPNEVMSILVQRVLEQRVTALLDKLLVKPSLVNLPPMEEGGLLLYLRVLAVAYEKTQELARDLRAVGCGDLDIEGLTESLFAAHKDEYPENEQASLKQLYQAKMEELCAESQSESSGTIGRSKGASVASSPTQISVTVVTEFVRWNEEAISRCNVFSSQPAILASNVRTVFTSLLEQVSGASTFLATKRFAVVTGANKGIGFEICKQLASQGITVVLTARDEKRGSEAVEKLMNESSCGLLADQVVFHQLDVTDPASIASLADFIAARFGKLDILVNNAGISGAKLDLDSFARATELSGGFPSGELVNWKELATQTYDLAVECVQINYYGAKRMVEALAPLLHLSDSPRIVNISSSLGLLEKVTNEWARGVLGDEEGLTEEKVDQVLNEFLKDLKDGLLESKGWSPHAYSLTKASMNAYTRILAKKYPTFCINSVCPGFVKTDINCNTGLLTAAQGAESPVRLALLPNGGPSGLFFNQKQVSSF